MTDFDPAAACVAAATWFHAAAELTAEVAAFTTPIQVVHTADDIEAIPVRTLTTVLDLLADNEPYSVVSAVAHEAGRSLPARSVA